MLAEVVAGLDGGGQFAAEQLPVPLPWITKERENGRRNELAR
jgi:hypothetical protein